MSNAGSRTTFVGTSSVPNPEAPVFITSLAFVSSTTSSLTSIQASFFACNANSFRFMIK
ncbi:hypothetical protein IJD44_06015 [bacterium]|nr:hypothetical protein [bacterium]